MEGNDTTGKGTPVSPWRTIQHAVDQLVPGDTLYVRAGTYAGFNVPVSGTERSPIKIRTYPGEEHRAVVDGKLGESGGRGVIRISAKDWIVLEGFEVREGRGDNIFIEGESGKVHGHHIIRNNKSHTCGNSGIYVCGRVMATTPAVGEYRTTDILIEGNEVWDTNNPGREYPWNTPGKPKTSGNECITVGGGVDGINVRKNTVRDSFQYGIDFKLQVRNGVIEDNTVFHMRKHGIYLDAACRPLQHIKIRNNRIHDCLTNGICLAREATRGPSEGYHQTLEDIDVYCNMVSGCLRGILLYKHPSDNLANAIDDVRIFNNTFFNSKRENIRLVDVAAATKDLVLANNIAYQAGETNIVNGLTGSIGYAGTNNIITDPAFVNAGDTPPDLHLRSGSVARGAGSAAYSPATDFSGTAFASPPAAGALEYRGP